MRAPFLLVSALLFALGACGKEADAGKTDVAHLEGETGCLGDCSEEAAPHDATAAAAAAAAAVDIEVAVAKADPKGVYGMGLSLEEFTKISDILARPDEFEGKRVKIKGEAIGVCEKRGCWIELKGDQPFQSIRIKVEDGEIVFPMSSKGREVVAEGVLQKLVFPVEKHREILASRAKAKGEAFDPASVTEELVVWQIKGLGAQIDG
jgi:hypothetical protein